MDTLVVIGDLLASQSFNETSLIVECDLLSLFSDVLAADMEFELMGDQEEPHMSQKSLQTIPVMNSTTLDNAKSSSNFGLDSAVAEEPPLTKLKFQETVMWALNNGIADDEDCR